MNFCQCEKDNSKFDKKQDALICERCKLPVMCEFSYLSDDLNDPDKDGIEHPAHVKNMDYTVCRKHSRIASDNIHGRTMS